MRITNKEQIHKNGILLLQNVLFIILITGVAMKGDNFLNFIPAWGLMLLMDLSKLNGRFASHPNLAVDAKWSSERHNLKPLFFDMVFIWILAAFYLLSLWFHMLTDWWSGLAVLILGFYLGTRYHDYGAAHESDATLFSPQHLQRNNGRLFVSIVFIVIGLVLAWFLSYEMVLWQIKAVSLLLLSFIAVFFGAKLEMKVCAYAEQKDRRRTYEFWFPTAFIIVAGSFCLMNSYLNSI